MSAPVVFRGVPAPLGASLTGFAAARGTKVGDAITVGGETFILDYVSRSSSAFWRSRGLSIYFRCGRSVVRISDHWSSSRHQSRSRKFNCGSIDSARWSVQDGADDLFVSSAFGGSRFPHRLIAGRAGLCKLNQSVDHWL